jgi:hypothetical protein
LTAARSASVMNTQDSADMNDIHPISKVIDSYRYHLSRPSGGAGQTLNVGKWRPEMAEFGTVQDVVVSYCLISCVRCVRVVSLSQSGGSTVVWRAVYLLMVCLFVERCE